MAKHYPRNWLCTKSLPQRTWLHLPKLSSKIHHQPTHFLQIIWEPLIIWRLLTVTAELSDLATKACLKTSATFLLPPLQAWHLYLFFENEWNRLLLSQTVQLPFPYPAPALHKFLLVLPQQMTLRKEAPRLTGCLSTSAQQ